MENMCFINESLYKEERKNSHLKTKEKKKPREGNKTLKQV